MTDFEAEALSQHLNLADGHAYHELADTLRPALDDLSALWEVASSTPVPEMEHRFRDAFGRLAQTPAMRTVSEFQVCPTASNAIDIVGAVLASIGGVTRLVEPTFDNVALILRRRLVSLEPVSDEAIYLVEENTVDRVLGLATGGALFLVLPNNPNGRTLTPTSLRTIAHHCVRTDRILVLDNSFRFYNRSPFDDYRILDDTKVSFMTIEDTGKVWPTHDMKASLLSCSADLQPLMGAIYRELYLCSSRFTLALLERMIRLTEDHGLEDTVWSLVDTRRAQLRHAITLSGLEIDLTAVSSGISVEWISTRSVKRSDLEVLHDLRTLGIRALPGRQFFWHSGTDPSRQSNIRLSLCRPRRVFDQSIALLSDLRLR